MVAYMKEGRLNIKEGGADTYRWRMDGCKEREKNKGRMVGCIHEGR